MRIFTTKTNCIQTVLACLAVLFYLNTLSKTGIARAFQHFIMRNGCTRYATENLTAARLTLFITLLTKKLSL